MRPTPPPASTDNDGETFPDHPMSHHEALKQQGDVIWNIANLLRGPYEIPFNRHFYEYVPPRPLEAIEADIEALERDIMAMLKAVTA